MKRIILLSAVMLMAVSSVTFCEREDVFEFSTAPQKIYLFTDDVGRTGDFGGLSGGDSICQGIKDSNFSSLNLSTVIIMAGDGSTNLKNRLPSEDIPVYGIYGSTETLISTSINGLWDSSIDNNLQTATGMTSTQWWSGTGSDGTTHSSNCSNWTSPSVGFQGQGGGNTFTDYQWISASSFTCDTMYPILCAGW